MGAEPADPDSNGLLASVRCLELAVARIGAMLQGQLQQQVAAARQSDELRATLGALAHDASATGRRLDELTDLLDARLPRPDASTGHEPTRHGPRVIVRPAAGLAARMIQHLVALSIAARVPACRVCDSDLPEWGIPAIPAGPAGPAITADGMRLDIDALAARLRRGEAATIVLSGLGQHVGQLGDPATHRPVFAGPPDILGYGPNTLLISLRLGTVGRGEGAARAAPRTLLPVGFYRQLIDEAGLRPVFFGSLVPCAYLDDLKAACPEARFVQAASPVHEFQTIRRSRHLVTDLDTFSWLAAWLSDAERVVLPLAGPLHPVMGARYGRGRDLVPRRDPRYRLVLFPFGGAVDPDERAAGPAANDANWRDVGAADIDDLLDPRRLASRSLDRHAALFDDAYYRQAYPDVDEAIEAGLVDSARHHYERHGFAQNRAPFALDLHYAHRHPDAGLAISDGRFADLHHFHAERGHALGYRPTRPAAAASTPKPGRPA